MRTFISLILPVIFVSGCQNIPAKQEFRSLFNGNDLSGWDVYIGPSFDSAGNQISGSATGLNHDPLKVFSVSNTDGKSSIRVSGEKFGGISTTEEFSNYHLIVEFKWGTEKWAPRENDKRDSGLLYHGVGPHGADYGYWMRSQEFQVEEGNCGDYWGCAGGAFDIPAIKKDSGEYLYDPKASFLEFSATSEQNRHCIKVPDAEKPTGEWNTLELYCFGDTSVHVVNGKTVMILYNSRQQDNGVESPLKKGKIQLQSEGAEVYYTNIRIRPIEKIPAEVL